jgi:hypothetical protein
LGSGEVALILDVTSLGELVTGDVTVGGTVVEIN